MSIGLSSIAVVDDGTKIGIRGGIVKFVDDNSSIPEFRKKQEIPILHQDYILKFQNRIADNFHALFHLRFIDGKGRGESYLVAMRGFGKQSVAHQFQA